VASYGGLSASSLTTFNQPPAAGAHAGDAGFFEVVVTYPITMLFMPALGAGRHPSVQARAVAGFEPVQAPALVALLDPTASPGLRVNGSAGLVVAGRIVVNASASPAADAGSGQVEAALYQVVGPAVAGSFNAYPGTTGRLELSHAPVPDPLNWLPTPAATSSLANQTASPLASAWNSQNLGSPSVQASGATGLVKPNHVDARGTVQLYPGVYQSITVSGGSVNLNPGVYILSPVGSPPYALDVTGGTVNGAGVMFYNTGADFDPTSGDPDSADHALYTPGPGGANAPPASAAFQGGFAGIRLDASNNANITLSALDDTGDPFFGMLIYQRRANLQTMSITGGNLSLSGTIYAMWAPIDLAGAGTYQAQFIAGSMQLGGSGTTTLGSSGSLVKANQVFLVE
jgi:hypothetical protein